VRAIGLMQPATVNGQAYSAGDVLLTSDDVEPLLKQADGRMCDLTPNAIGSLFNRWQGHGRPMSAMQVADCPLCPQFPLA
jgi:hypothetical protein